MEMEMKSCPISFSRFGSLLPVSLLFDELLVESLLNEPLENVLWFVSQFKY